MRSWFNNLSAGRKFVVGWNLVLLPVVVPALIYLLFFSGLALPLDPLLMLGMMIVFGAVGGLIAWQRFR